MQTILPAVRLAGLAVTTGPLVRDFLADGLAAGQDAGALERTARTVGLRRRLVAAPGQTALDLCADAATRLLAACPEPAAQVDAVIFVTQTPDHAQPNNACLLHGRLGLARTVAAYDVSLGCSGWVYALQQAALLCAHGGARAVLLCAGDTLSRTTNPRDRATDPLFGDAGSATLVVRDPAAGAWHFVLGTDGARARVIEVPGGGARSPRGAEPWVEHADADGNVRHPGDLHMDGAEVFNFSLREVPAAIAEVMALARWSEPDVDALVLHQANRFVLSAVGRKGGFPAAKTPMDLVERFGNQSSASIPCALVEALGPELGRRPLRVVACGFGVGLSWGAVALTLGPVTLVPTAPLPPAP
ncbi:3-oxoacyl-[acyl-carrier-protein] synthase 3 [Opitutia bacterium]|nr:3-oxoacyl-[acyl-carrier-protein] synthase 3 [Opitutae bacterium]